MFFSKILYNKRDDFNFPIVSGRFGALISDQPTISLEMPVPSQGHYGFHNFPVVD